MARGPRTSSTRVPRSALVIFIVFLSAATLLNLYLLSIMTEGRSSTSLRSSLPPKLENGIRPIKSWLSELRHHGVGDRHQQQQQQQQQKHAEGHGGEEMAPGGGREEGANEPLWQEGIRRGNELPQQPTSVVESEKNGERPALEVVTEPPSPPANDQTDSPLPTQPTPPPASHRPHHHHHHDEVDNNNNNNNDRRPVIEIGDGGNDEEDGAAPSSTGAAAVNGLSVDVGGAPSLPQLGEGERDTDDEANSLSYDAALAQYHQNLKVVVPQDPKQPTKDFFDVLELPDHGILLPHDPTQTVHPALWQACDPRDAEFTPTRDELCQQYLRNLNNVRSIKTLSAVLKRGRTIKFKLYYRHGGIQAIVKVSQNKFVFEAASEYLAFALDRELNMTRTPTAVYTPIPLDFMRAAAAVMGPFYSQWFQNYIISYDFTRRMFVQCEAPTIGRSQCSYATIILWMSDVHSALMSNLAVPFEYDEVFAEKFYTPGYVKWPPKPLRLRAVGDLCLRFAFDFLMGNTDRGMNDHNNFVYGGCDETSRCSPRPPDVQTKGIAKYAFIDHGSSFYSRQEPKENPFTGNVSEVMICRFRRSMRDNFVKYRSPRTNGAEAGRGYSDPTDEDLPLVTSIKKKLPKGLFHVISKRVFDHIQKRLDKILQVMDHCVEKYGGKEEEVYSLPEYWETAVGATAAEEGEHGKRHRRHHLEE